MRGDCTCVAMRMGWGGVNGHLCCENGTIRADVPSRPCTVIVGVFPSKEPCPPRSSYVDLPTG